VEKSQKRSGILDFEGKIPEKKVYIEGLGEMLIV